MTGSATQPNGDNPYLTTSIAVSVFDACIAQGRSPFRRVKVSAILATAILTLSSTANSQVNDGREEASQRLAETVMANFAKCVVGNKKREAKALEYLLLPDGDPKKSTQGSAIAVSGCAPPGSQMRFQPDLFSRSIYTALYRKYYGRTPPGDLPAIEAPDYRSEYDVTTTPVATQQLTLRAFGDCAVKQNPKAAHDFAISEMRGQSEKTAVPILVEAMKPCLDTGATLKFSRTMLKGIVAESLYKMRVRQTEASANAAGAGQ